MGFRFRKSIKVLPGVRVNVGKKGASLTVGGRGATANISKRGVSTTVGIPGTGLSYTTQHVKYNTAPKPLPTPSSSGDENVAMQIAIALIILCVIGGTVSHCSSSAKPPEIATSPATPRVAPTVTTTPVDFDKPTWCKKAKTPVELMVCDNSDLSSYAIDLDKRWDAYKSSKPKGDVAKARAYLRTWNKETFQTCELVHCVAQAYGEAMSNPLLKM